MVTLPETAERRPLATDGAPKPTPTASLRGGRYPVAFASLFEQVPGRTLRALAIRCPRCGGTHLGCLRAGAEAGGLRRTPCGLVVVVVKRTYRGTGAA